MNANQRKARSTRPSSAVKSPAHPNVATCEASRTELGWCTDGVCVMGMENVPCVEHARCGRRQQLLALGLCLHLSLHLVDLMLCCRVLILSRCLCLVVVALLLLRELLLRRRLHHLRANRMFGGFSTACALRDRASCNYHNWFGRRT